MPGGIVQSADLVGPGARAGIYGVTNTRAVDDKDATMARVGLGPERDSARRTIKSAQVL
jgi:hypothetical protein